MIQDKSIKKMIVSTNAGFSEYIVSLVINFKKKNIWFKRKNPKKVKHVYQNN